MKVNLLTEQEWEQFFDLVKKIVDGPFPWEEKKEAVAGKVKEFGMESEFFEEFVSWFDEG